MVALEARKATSERSTSSCNSKSPQALNPARKNVMNGMLLCFTVRVCWFLQNQCRSWLHLNRMCDYLLPTTEDARVLGQKSQPINPPLKRIRIARHQNAAKARRVLLFGSPSWLVMSSNLIGALIRSIIVNIAACADGHDLVPLLTHPMASVVGCVLSFCFSLWYIIP